MLQIGLALWLAAVGLAQAPATTSPATARERIAWLAAEIARHDELYFKQAAPEITDAAYDELKRELRALQAAHPAWAASAVAGVGDDRSGRFPERAHRVRMLSLEKSYTEAELRAFMARVRRQLAPAEPVFVVEPKFDGLAISVTYAKGRLTQAVTRGNGREGEEVTENLLALAGVPRALARAGGVVPELIELRGEVYMTWAEFRRINRAREAAGLEPQAHPRNLAVGTLKQSSDAREGDRRLAVVFYGVGACEPQTARPASEQALLRTLRGWGLPTIEQVRASADADEVWRAVEAVGAGRKQLAFPIDGAVIKVDDAGQQLRLGETEEAPRWAVAYKFPPDRAATRVTGITLQVGRTGVLTPVAELDPVRLGGATVRRASLHNRREIARADIRVGDWAWLEKAGEIIPVIAGVDRARRPVEATPYEFPVDCPECGTKLIFEDTTVRCPNYDCAAQVRRRLEYFVSDAAVDINGVGRVLIASLVARKLAAHPADLYRLDQEVWRSVAPPKRADKIIAALAASRSRERWRLVCGVGVPEVGPAAAKAIARHFPDLATWARATERDYAGSGVSEAAQRAALRHFAVPARRAEVEQLQQAIQPGA